MFADAAWILVYPVYSPVLLFIMFADAAWILACPVVVENSSMPKLTYKKFLKSDQVSIVMLEQ